MPSFNRVTLIGNLTRDPESRQLSSGTTLAEFGLASSRRYKTAGGEEREEVCFVDCTAFGRQAEVIQQYCRKGKLVLVEGRLKYDHWEDKATGGKRSKLSVVVEGFQFLGTRQAEANDAPPHPVAADAPEQAPVRPARPRRQSGAPFNKSRTGEAPKFKESDIPF